MVIRWYKLRCSANQFDRTKKAGESTNIIFPVALMNYKGKQSLINLYPGASSRISQEEINSAEVLMEYQFAKALDKMTKQESPGLGMTLVMENLPMVVLMTWYKRSVTVTGRHFKNLSANRYP